MIIHQALCQKCNDTLTISDYSILYGDELRIRVEPCPTCFDEQAKLEEKVIDLEAEKDELQGQVHTLNDDLDRLTKSTKEGESNGS
jgi:hypothetical protein